MEASPADRMLDVLGCLRTRQIQTTPDTDTITQALVTTEINRAFPDQVAPLSPTMSGFPPTRT